MVLEGGGPPFPKEELIILRETKEIRIQLLPIQQKQQNLQKKKNKYYYDVEGKNQLRKIKFIQLFYKKKLQTNIIYHKMQTQTN